MDDDISDEKLMLNYSHGDADAFEVLYQRHKGPLYRFVLRQCGQPLVDELFQDIWLKVVNARSRYEVKATFKTWLYRIARNHIIDHYRKQQIRPANNHPEAVSVIRSAEQSQPENRLEANDQREQLMKAIASLPAEQKEVFLLKEEAGLGLEEIALTTGINYETAKSRLRYAVKKLQQRLEMTHDQ